MFKSFTKRLLGAMMSFLLFTSITLAQIDPALQESIDKGVEWLLAQQNEDGSWGDYYEVIAQTGFALTKLSDYALENGNDPIEDPDIMEGFDYLFSMAKTHGTDKGITIVSDLCNHHETYNAAVALMALASLQAPDHVITSTNPLVDGLKVIELMAEMVEYFAWSQHPQGGWSYEPCYPGSYLSDNSHTGYVVIALRYAEDAGIPMPAGLKTNLSTFIDLIQDDVNGASWYTTSWQWYNALKQGNLLLEMSFVGDPVDAPRVEAALTYLASVWNEPNPDIDGMGWKDPQAMYCLMKGLESFGIETITVGTDEIDWFEVFSAYIIANQAADGYWTSVWDYSLDYSRIPATSWALFVLEKIAPPPPMVYVDLDIHPMSWPNPIQLKSKGVTPVAILGTEEFDVENVDVTTLLLEGVAPVKWIIYDSTTPDGDDDGCNATMLGPDGYMDLVLYFNTQELLNALAPVSPGDELVLKLTGNLTEGRPLEGDDCVLIVKSLGKKSAELEITDMRDFVLEQNYPNPFNSSTRISYYLPDAAQVSIKVFNLLGQEVHTLVNQHQTEGEHSITWDGKPLQNGTYFYRMIVDNFIDTHTMIINR